MKTTIPLIRLVSCLALATLLSACTHMEKVSTKPSAISAGTKIPGRAGLVIDDNLLKYQFEFKMMGDKWVFPFGQSLKDYAKNVSDNCFSSVTVYSSDKAAAGQGANLILHPKPLKAEQAMGVMAWSDRKFTLQVEWTAKDGLNDRTVWLQTITAEGVNKSGNAFTYKKRQDELFQFLFDDLTTKTVNAIRNSPELKAAVDASR